MSANSQKRTFGQDSYSSGTSLRSPVINVSLTALDHFIWGDQLNIPRPIFHALLGVGVFVLNALPAFFVSAEFLEIELPDGSDIDTYLYKPSGKGPYPAVIVVPVFWGMNDYSKEFSEELSGADYVTLTVNFRTGSGWADAKIGATYDYLQKLPEVDPERIGIVGFSKGGELGLNTIIDWGDGYPPRPVRAMISYYLGSHLRFPHSDDPPILFLHGDKDDRTQWQEIVAFCEESRKEGRVCDYKIYKDTTHSFTHSSGGRHGVYDFHAERDAYKRAVAFLNKYLRDAPIQ